MKKAGLLFAICSLVACAASVPAAAAQPDAAVAPHLSDAASHAQRAQERADIQHAREALAQRRQREEAACYQRFAVEDCLRRVRTPLREQDDVLLQRELQVDEAERRDRAAQRRRMIEEQQASQHGQKPAGERPALMHGQLRGQEQARQAHERAAQQVRQQAEHAAQQRQRIQQEPQRAAQARMRYEAKQRQAAERRARHARQQAEAASAGRKPVSPLPQPQD